MLSFYKYGSDSEIEKLQTKVMIAIWQKVTILVANLLVVVELTTTIQIKRIS